MRPLLFAQAIVVCLASNASAAEPTLEQLLATPSPNEIVARWKAVCLDHADDQRAQQRAARQLRIDWPYQAMFDNAAGKPACMMVSSTELDATAQSFGDAITEATAPLVLENVEVRDGSFKASMVIDGSVFRVQASLTPSEGVTAAVVALIDMEEERP